MSRAPRAGTAGRPVTIRATATERAAWERCAKGAGQVLSDWLRGLANDEAREAAIARSARRRGRHHPITTGADFVEQVKKL